MKDLPSIAVDAIDIAYFSRRDEVSEDGLSCIYVVCDCVCVGRAYCCILKMFVSNYAHISNRFTVYL